MLLYITLLYQQKIKRYQKILDEELLLVSERTIEEIYEHIMNSVYIVAYEVLEVNKKRKIAI